MRNPLQMLPGIAVTVCGLVAIIVGFTFFSWWWPWMLGCGGIGNYCGGPYLPPNPYPVQDLFLVLICAAIAIGCWSLVDPWRRGGLRVGIQPWGRAPEVLLVVAGTWLLAFVVSWSDYSLDIYWNASTRYAISGLFLASLVPAPAVVTFAGVLLLWNLVRWTSAALAIRRCVKEPSSGCRPPAENRMVLEASPRSWGSST